MKKTDKVLSGELIGSGLEVASSKNAASIGIKGVVVDETRNTLTVLTKEGKKRLIKDQNTFTIDGITIRGDELVSRPEERIKKWLKKRKTSASR